MDNFVLIALGVAAAPLVISIAIARFLGVIIALFYYGAVVLICSRAPNEGVVLGGVLIVTALWIGALWAFYQQDAF